VRERGGGKLHYFEGRNPFSAERELGREGEEHVHGWWLRQAPKDILSPRGRHLESYLDAKSKPREVIFSR